jgi:hypothetical protein
MIAAAGLIAAGCGGSHLAAGSGNGATAVRAQNSDAGHPDPSPDRNPQPGLGPDPRSSWSALCAAAPSTGLRADLARAVPESLRAKVVPLGMSAHGPAVYASVWTPSFAGVAALSLATGSMRKVQSFGDRATDQADGSSDGGWLVWEETYSLQSLDDFAVYAFDAATGRLLKLGHSLAGPGGVPWPSPWHSPAVSGHYAAWAQGYGPDGEVEIRLADLATGQVRVIRTGHTQPPFFDRSMVVWPESDRPGAQTSLHAFSLVTGRLTGLPPVLRAVHGTEFVVTDGTRTAYFSPDLTALYYSRAPGTPARIWTTTTATYLASTATGTYAQVTPEYGFATGSGPQVLVSDPAASKAGQILALHVVSPAALASSGCVAGTGGSR